jgi:diguanylate cyclase (GGDEF)-like protein
VITLGIDFSYPMASGDHDVTVEKIEFVGEWISRELWYLGILCLWMFGVFVYAANQLRLLRDQTLHDTAVINKLNRNNEELKIETDKFRRLSTVDPLTQTFNRFGIDQIISSLIPYDNNKQQILDTPNLSVILLDIDHFKRINDNRGHDAGDRVLKKMSDIIQSSIRKNDFLGRWGGEEFLLIAPNTTTTEAFALAETIRDAVENYKFEPDKPLHVTASLGVGTRLGEEDFATLFKRVDNALYKAKHEGRNCCVIAEEK